MAREVTQGYCKDSACAYDVYTKHFVDEKVIPHLGGVKDYEKLEKKPKINGVELTGDKALDELGISQSGIYVGDDEPTDENINVWIDTSEGASVIYSSSIPNYDVNIKSICHRGYNTIAPENTIPAYLLANDKGFKYVECDVSFTSDKVPVLLHDNTIDRTSDGTGNVHDMTYEQLLAYDFGSYKGEKYKGTKIPTFDEFMKYCKYLGLHPYIELKWQSNTLESDVQNVVDIVAKNGMKGKVTYISFNITYLQYLKNYDDEARIGYVVNTVDETTITNANKLKTENNEVFIDSLAVNEDIVNLCIENGYALETWTVNTEAKIKNLHSYVSGVTSDSLIASKVLYESYSKHEYDDVTEPDDNEGTGGDTGGETEDPTGWHTVKTLTGDELVVGALTPLYNEGTYLSTNALRLSYNKFDIEVEYGYKYKIEYESIYSNNFIALQVANETAVNCVLENKNYSYNDYKDSGWQKSGYEYTPDEKHNGSPLKAMRLMFKGVDTTTGKDVNMTVGAITNIIVSRIKI